MRQVTAGGTGPSLAACTDPFTGPSRAAYHEPIRRDQEHTGDLAVADQTLAPHLKRSLPWDQGREMSAHRSFTVATDVPIHVCDPGSP
ncbi:hypothetical protein [Streptomyces sp. NPDC058695]|uniref:hypothetical protein n=1 Tax=Streptomyces sp. NPDC058695 TaxID=3346604 RepID=UPI003654514B